MQNKTPVILSVGTHHDDNAMVGGTLARHKAAGWRVVSVVMTNGRYIDGKAADEHVAIRDVTIISIGFVSIKNSYVFHIKNCPNIHCPVPTY